MEQVMGRELELEQEPVRDRQLGQELVQEEVLEQPPRLELWPEPGTLQKRMQLVPV
jgi:hypothetical protein